MTISRNGNLFEGTLLVYDGNWGLKDAIEEPKDVAEVLAGIRSKPSTTARSQRQIKTPPPQASSLGRQIGPYLLIESLDEGRDVQTFKARDTRNNNLVTLRALGEQASKDVDRRQEFCEAAALAAKLQHPSFLKSSKAGRSREGTYFCVTELVKGANLKTWFDGRRSLPEAEVIKMGIQLCQALTYAQSQGIPYLGIRPERIVISSSGIAKVVQSGSMGSGEHGLEQPLALAPEYASPENVVKGAVPDVRSDIYTLGTILFRAATGQPLFQAATPELILLSHAQERAPWAQKINSVLSDTFSRILAKTLAKDPAERYQTPQKLFEALIHALEELESDKVIEEPRVEEPRPVPFQGRGKRILLGALLGAAVWFGLLTLVKPEWPRELVKAVDAWLPGFF